MIIFDKQKLNYRILKTNVMYFSTFKFLNLNFLNLIKISQTQYVSLGDDEAIILFTNFTKNNTEYNTTMCFGIRVSKKLISVLVTILLLLPKPEFKYHFVIDITDNKKVYNVKVSGYYTMNYFDLNLFLSYNRDFYRLGFLNVIDKIYKRDNKFFIVFSHSPESEVEISSDNFNFFLDQYSRVNSKTMLYISVVNSLILDISILRISPLIFFVVNDCLLMEDVILHYIDLSDKYTYIIFYPETSKYRIYKPNQMSFEDCSAESFSTIKESFSFFIEDSTKSDYLLAFKTAKLHRRLDLIRILSPTKAKVSLSIIDEKNYYFYRVQFLLKQCRLRASQRYYSHTYYYFDIADTFNVCTGEALAEILETHHSVFSESRKFKYDNYILNYFLLEKDVNKADFAIGLHKKNLLQLVALKSLPRNNIYFDEKCLYNEFDLEKNKKWVNEDPKAWLLVRIERDLDHLNYLTNPFLVLNALFHYKTFDFFLQQSYTLIMHQVLTSIKPRVVNKQLLLNDLNNIFIELDTYQYFIVSYKNPHDYLSPEEVECFRIETNYPIEIVKDLLIRMKYKLIQVPGVKKKKS